MVSTTEPGGVAGGIGGAAVRLTPLSLQYLSCLTTSRSMTDKLAFDVGLQEDATGAGATGRRG